MVNALLLLFMFLSAWRRSAGGQRIIGIETADFCMEHNHQANSTAQPELRHIFQMLFTTGCSCGSCCRGFPGGSFGVLDVCSSG